MSQHKLYTSIFGSAAADEKEVKLKEITTRYPYFSAAHYFLLQCTAKDSQDHARVAGRTALHFNNPFYLNFLLNNDIPLEVVEEKNQTPGSDGSTEEKNRPDTESQQSQAAGKKGNPDELMFEPLHTTDYFASQGIKLSEEVKPDDKLGKQLRSFTDWLKTMKKVHEQKLPSGNPALDITVQNIADKSNQEEEIVTESMADVYKDQGKKARAKEIYHKLSLLDPSKSAYFAAKIDSLKDI